MPSPHTLPLFDDETDEASPAEKPRTLVAVLARTRPTDKSRLAFQRLVEKIERKRDELQRWQACIARYQQRLAGEIEPLQAKLRDGQRQMAFLVDELLTEPAPGRRLGKMQKAKLRQLLLNLVRGLLEEDGDDAELLVIHDRHSDVSHAQENQDDIELTQAMLKDIFGVDVGDDHGAATADELLQKAQEKMQARAQEQARAAEEKRVARAAKRAAKSGKTKPAPHTPEGAKARRDEEAEQASQSIREVYRKLASALHPDREPDPAERERKTGLMQRVNDAYAAKDLLTLLGVQLEIEQIDAEHLATVSPQRLIHFTQVLREQLSELELEITHCVMPFRMTLQVRDITPAVIDGYLDADLRTLQSTIDSLKDDMVAFRDPVRLTASLKHYPLETEDDEDDGDGDFLDFLDAFGPAPPMPSRPGPRSKPATVAVKSNSRRRRR